METPTRGGDLAVALCSHHAGESTPEAQAAGCLCRFEINMEAAFLAAESSEVADDETIVVIHKDCPLHRIAQKPMDDAVGDH